MFKKLTKSAWTLPIVLMLLAIPLRFNNLGYSDYIGDEHKAFVKLAPNQTYVNFFLTRRKGPTQFLVSLLPYLITHDYRNELAQRVPFALISTVSVVVFYGLILKVTKNRTISFLSAFLFTVNGFTVGFGRIAQYQSLNIFFSFLALYFYVDLLNRKKNALKSSLIGTVCFSLSVLSHWDAVFILPVVIYIFIKYLCDKTIKKEYKTCVLKNNIFLGCILLLPFLLPYTYYQSRNVDNKMYFFRRIEFGNLNYKRYKLLIDLYNPFVTFWFFITTALIGLFKIRQNHLFLIWFLFNYGVFEFFVRKPGTHIYNFIIPILVISSYGLFFLIKAFPKYFKLIPVALICVLCGYLYYQSYVIFVDHSREYPWQQKELLSFNIWVKKDKRKTRHEIKKMRKEVFNLTTPKYNINQKLPLFGFPHYRGWNEINDYLNFQNIKNNEKYGYITNEVKTKSEWYMDAKYKSDDGFYAIGIKRPLSFVNDWGFTPIGKKKLVEEFSIGDETKVRIYRKEK